MKYNILLTAGRHEPGARRRILLPANPAHAEKTDTETVVLKDYGAEPTTLNIESYTLTNENFRTTLWTG